MHKFVQMLVVLVLLFSILFKLEPATAKTLETEPIKFENATELRELISKSDVIAFGALKPAYETIQLNQMIGQSRMINTKQLFSLSKVWKGPGKRAVIFLSTGLDPLPEAKSPLNLQYPGELANGNYIFFLKRLSGTPYYQLTTGMQSVYPVFNGKSISLKGTGFSELDGLTLKEFETKISKG